MAGLAEKMFWRSPELVDNLINFLDVESVAELAKANPFTAELLESSKKTWGELVQRSCPFYQHEGLPVEDGDHGWDDHTYRPWVEDRFAEQQVNVSHLTRILSTMESPMVPLLELLHVICERFPPVLFKAEDNVYPFSPEKDGQPMAFHLKCPCKRSHAVTHLGFLLLEKVESTLGSAEQEVDKVFISNLVEPWFSALQARAVRQQRKVRAQGEGNKVHLQGGRPEGEGN